MWSFLGCGFVVVSLLSIIALVGFLVAAFNGSSPLQANRLPIPDDVPPAAAEPAPNIDLNKPGRTADQLARWARGQVSETNIPYQALIAYGNAENIARQTRPECGLSWNTLAGLGYVETKHGSHSSLPFRGTKLNENGTADPKIFGPQLNGDKFARIEDTDNGELDGDKEFDRAMGPMQFIPETWRHYGVDANGDGVADPQNIDDAAAAAVGLLCDFGRDLRTPEGWTQAIRSYNQSDEYVRDVRDAAANYALGQSAAVI